MHQDLGQITNIYSKGEGRFSQGMEVLPLFVLPMVLMPGEVQELRIFEPRYRQMLDDCLLDEKNFGLVLNDPFEPINSWDGPRRHGCEVEILHHETKGVHHFIQIVGRRRFTVHNVIAPALPPMSDPLFEGRFEEDGLLPDLQSLLEFVPEEVEHSKLYISAEVEYLAQYEPLSIEQQVSIKELLNNVLTRIGLVLRIKEEMLEPWIKERIENSVDESPDSISTVSTLVLNELETKQQVLSCDTVEEAVEELLFHASAIQEEE